MKIGEGYVKDSMVDDTIVGTTLANIAVGHGQTYSRDKISNDALRLFETSSALVTVDPLQLVTTSDNPEQALQSHINHIETTLSKIDSVGKTLHQLAQEHRTASQECYETKRAGDQLFFQGANAADAALSDAGLAQSVEASPCYITHRVQANAYSYLADKVVTHQVLLTQRRDILVTNKDLLVTHHTYLDDGVLDQLVSLRNKMRQVNQTTYDTSNFGSFGSPFGFNFLDPNAPLPRFNKIRRDEGETPTFLEPNLDRSNENFRFQSQ